MTEPTEDMIERDVHPMANRLFGWVESKRTPQIFFWGLLALSVVLILAELAVHRHAKEAIEGVFGFYGFWGFAAFFGVVLTGWPLGRLLRRTENYYGDDDADAPQTQEEL